MSSNGVETGIRHWVVQIIPRESTPLPRGRRRLHEVGRMRYTGMGKRGRQGVMEDFLKRSGISGFAVDENGVATDATGLKLKLEVE